MSREVRGPQAGTRRPEMCTAVSIPGMHSTLYEAEHEAFRDSVRAFVAEHVVPFHDQWERDGMVDRALWLEAGAQGLLGTDVPERYGGGGTADFRYNCVVDEELVGAASAASAPRCTTTSWRRTCSAGPPTNSGTAGCRASPAAR